MFWAQLGFPNSLRLPPIDLPLGLPSGDPKTCFFHPIVILVGHWVDRLAPTGIVCYSKPSGAEVLVVHFAVAHEHGPGASEGASAPFDETHDVFPYLGVSRAFCGQFQTLFHIFLTHNPMLCVSPKVLVERSACYEQVMFSTC